VASSESAHAGWLMARAVGRIAESASDPSMLRDIAREIGRDAVANEPERFASMRARVAKCPHSVFLDWSRDAADAFGDADAATATHTVLCALIEGIKIIDDIQDEEPECLATEIGVERALNLALGAFAHGLELTAALPWPDAQWRAATASIGRGVRETAIGQELELTSDGSFDGYWAIVDAKSTPLVATALELGVLATGADPSRAAALTRIARPLARLLQVGDDCNDALGTNASDWRAPDRNLLMLYSLSGPRGPELAALLRDAADPETLREAQLVLLRDGALAYAVHAQVTLLDELDAAILTLALPNPEPFRWLLESQRAATARLLRQSGVEEEVAAKVIATAG